MSILEYNYEVEVFDFIRNVTLFHEEYHDSNTAYHDYRKMQDRYNDSYSIIVKLKEPG